MATNYYQDPLGAPDYSAQGMPSLLSLSNLESLGRGSVAGLFDLPYVIEGMLRGDQDLRMPQRRRVVPSSEQVLATTPRMTQPTPQAGLLETAGAFMSPAPVAAVKPVAKAVGRAIRATEGLPVGMSIKPINLNKGIYKPELTMEEMLKVKDIPTVDRVKQSIDLVGEKEFEKMVNAQYKKYKPSDQDQEAMLVESVTLNILGKAQRSPYPQQSALDLAQQRAALPVEQGGLGLPANNTAMDRARAMGFETSALHGSGTPYINVFDPNLVGTKAGNAFDNYMWFTSSPESASGYALNTNQFALIPDVKALNNQINQIGKDISSAYTNKNMDKVGDLRKELSVLMKQKSDIYKDFEMGKYISEGSTTYPVLLKSNEFMPYEANNQNWMKVNRPAIEESQSRGFQGVEIKNVKDNPNPSIGSVISNTYATENPDLIRSRFAAFDPFRRTAATAAVMGVAAPDLLAAEPTPEELQRRQSASLLFPTP